MRHLTGQSSAYSATIRAVSCDAPSATTTDVVCRGMAIAFGDDTLADVFADRCAGTTLGDTSPVAQLLDGMFDGMFDRELDGTFDGDVDAVPIMSSARSDSRSAPSLFCP